MIYYDSFKPLCSPYFCTIRYVIVHKYNTCTAILIDAVVLLLTETILREEQKQRKRLSVGKTGNSIWQRLVRHLRVIFSAVGGTAVYL